MFLERLIKPKKINPLEIHADSLIQRLINDLNPPAHIERNFGTISALIEIENPDGSKSSFFLELQNCNQAVIQQLS